MIRIFIFPGHVKLSQIHKIVMSVMPVKAKSVGKMTSEVCGNFSTNILQVHLSYNEEMSVVFNIWFRDIHCLGISYGCIWNASVKIQKKKKQARVSICLKNQFLERKKFCACFMLFACVILPVQYNACKIIFSIFAASIYNSLQCSSCGE